MPQPPTTLIVRKQLIRTGKLGKTSNIRTAAKKSSKSIDVGATAIKIIIDSISALLSLTWKLGLFYGGIWLFFYCFFAIRFFPIGVTPADGLFLIAIALGFGLLILILGAMGFFIWKPIFSQSKFITAQTIAQPSNSS